MTVFEGCEVVKNAEDLVQEAKQEYEKSFGSPPTHCAVAPGRVNLIGEHTDYNDGFVLPMALPMVTVVVGARNGKGDDECVVVTNTKGCDEPYRSEFSCVGLKHDKSARPKWAHYVKGVVANFHEELEGMGFNAMVVTSVPLGGGLSSSASLEVSMYTFLESLTSSSSPSSTQKALACQKAEHEFAGMPCGIMDQFISVMGEEGRALKIDCRSIETEAVELKDDSLAVLITNSNVKHQLTGSEYPTRRKHCYDAASFLGKPSLRDVSLKELQSKEADFDSSEMFRRARHVVTEIERTDEGAKALNEGKYEEFGKLMVQSHESLRDDFEVSCPEVDSLVSLALGVPGVYGSRMTGGGFGGCSVTLLKKESVEQCIKTMREGYEHGKATFYVCTAAQGARVVEL